MKKYLQIFIESNLFIAFAAIAFMWANAIILHIQGMHLICVTGQIFFATWFIYQFSRWIYFKKGVYVNQQDWIIQLYRQYPVVNKIMISIAFFFTFFFSFFLKIKSLYLLFFIGSISFLYPMPILKPFGISTRLRDFPFIKILLIALVWSVVGVLLPMTESGLHIAQRKDIYVVFVAQFIYILFITLPFDINDVEVDSKYKIKTIPVFIGIKNTKLICFGLGIIYSVLLIYIFMLENWRMINAIYLKESTIVLLLLLVVGLQMFTFFKSDKVEKWIIKLVYDGSMLIYFCILFLTT